MITSLKKRFFMTLALLAIGAGSTVCSSAWAQANAKKVKIQVAHGASDGYHMHRALVKMKEELEKSGRFDDTLVVFCSDHGDYLGDHHLGEKELWHDAAIKIPLIVYDPAAQAQASRGSTCDALVEAIDLVPTFLDALQVEGEGEIFAAVVDEGGGVAALEVGWLVELLGFADEVAPFLLEDELLDGLADLLALHEH